MTTDTQTALAYYAAHGASLFPIPAGQKDPFGIVGSFARDCSTDPAQWEVWRTANPGCNFGLVAGPSRLVIVDIDCKDGRDAAWALWVELCHSWDIPVEMPQVQSARGGWHVYFAVPDDVDAATLRQPDAVKKLINIRAGNGFTVAAGSFYDGTAKGETSGPYVLLSDVAPYPAPAALIEHCTRRAAPTESVSRIGTRDKGDVAALLLWLNERGAFEAYEDWVSAGMALKLEYGDDGYVLWESTFDESVMPDVGPTKWQSFATDPQPGVQTLSSLLDRAHKLGWRGNVRKSAGAMFDQVAQIAAASGAGLASGAPTGAAPAGMPMLQGQEVLADLSRPILTDFLAATVDAPARPLVDDYPRLPASMESHGVYSLMQDCIERVMALAEPSQKVWKPGRVTSCLAVLAQVHADVFDAVRRRLEAWGRPLLQSKIKLESKNLEDSVQRHFVKNDDWIFDVKSGTPESDNPDNVAVFLALIGAELRWNAWLNRSEIRGFNWPKWSPVDDVVVADLRTRAFRTGTRFRIGSEFLKECMLSLAYTNQFDPVLERINSLQWDGVPRLSIWLSRTCGVPCDLYHQTAGRNVIGGMVKRARNPGAKHDEVMILIGAQGTMKSTLCRVLAIEDEWFTDSVSFHGSAQNVVPQLFGKLVVELAELDGMNRTEVTAIKAFITRQSDNVTLKYNKFASDFPRRCMFIGTSNEHTPLVDATGNRRFLPVQLRQAVDIAWLRENIEQLVAEAAVLHTKGADFAIPREVWEVASKHQEAARGLSDIETMLTEWFAETPFTQHAYITKANLTDLCMLAGWRNSAPLSAVVMRRLGFVEDIPWLGGRKTRVWVRGGASGAAVGGLTHYTVGKTQDGRPRVIIALSSVAK